MLPFATNVSALSAVFYGLVSFLSPCVLPLIPAYLGMLAGEAAVTAASKRRGRLFLSGLLFVLGFTLVFVLMGATASFIGQWLLRFRTVLRIVSGALVILMGLFMMGVFSFSFLMREARLDVSALREKAGVFLPVVLGIGFSLGWTPCVGPMLTSLLLLAANQSTLGRGIWLLFHYAMGMGIPFLITALLADVLVPRIRKLVKHMQMVQNIAGALMILLGLAMITGWLDRLTTMLSR